MPLSYQVLFKLEIIFYDAVMDDGDRLIATRMRVGVIMAGYAVRGPTGVRDAERRNRRRVFGDQTHQIVDLTLGLADMEFAAGKNGDAGGIIPAVLQTLQP